MLFNILFEKMNEKLELVLMAVFFIAVYWLVLRRYNSLGLRLLFLCTCLFLACCAWLYSDEKILKNTITSGEEYVATVQSKTVTGAGKNNEVEVSFTTKDGKLIDTRTSKYISAQEWERFETGKPLSVLFVANTQETYVQQSIARFKNDKAALYYFAGFWLVLGIILFAWLRKYKVGVNKTGSEWLVKPDGAIIFDERT